MSINSRISRKGLSTVSILALSLASGCTGISKLQGSAEPVASPLATGSLNLPDEIASRAAILYGYSTKTITEPNKIPNLFYEKDVLIPVEKRGNKLDGSFTSMYLSYMEKCPSDRDTEDSPANPAPSESVRNTLKERVCLNKAGELFEYAALYSDRSDAKIDLRNSMQEELIRASTLSCSIYKRTLNAAQTRTNFLLGSATTVFAAAATVVSAPVAAQNWAAGATGASGLRAEFNADAFASQTAYVIAKAIDTDREATLAKIRKNQTKPYSEYKMQAAIADAFDYHDRCSLYRGIQVLDNSVTVAQDPGLKHISNWIRSGKIEVRDGKISATNVVTALADIGSPQAAVSNSVKESDASLLAGDLYLNATAQIIQSLEQYKKQYSDFSEQLKKSQERTKDGCDAKDPACDATGKEKFNKRLTEINQIFTSINISNGENYYKSTAKSDKSIILSGCYSNYFDPSKFIETTLCADGREVEGAKIARAAIDTNIQQTANLLAVENLVPEAKRDQTKISVLTLDLKGKRLQLEAFKTQQINPVLQAFNAWLIDANKKLGEANDALTTVLEDYRPK